MNRTPRYYLSHSLFGEREVTAEQFMQAEREAGFRPKVPGTVATGGFGSGSISGDVRYDEPSTPAPNEVPVDGPHPQIDAAAWDALKPALGGEPEVIYMLRNTSLNTPWRDADKAAFDWAAGLPKYERRELIYRASIAPLQAEIESERSLRRSHAARIHELSDEVKDLKGERCALQSDLTEALELLSPLAEDAANRPNALLKHWAAKASDLLTRIAALQPTEGAQS